uniref:Uncharacterized protein n=1 Tax=Anguilla anguilla TaxID=7936 RepID=A0A0E9QNC3_ANGAN
MDFGEEPVHEVGNGDDFPTGAIKDCRCFPSTGL